jgi:hypothetical protein
VDSICDLKKGLYTTTATNSEIHQPHSRDTPAVLTLLVACGGHMRPWHEDKAMRVTCYLLFALALTVSVTLSIIEILR